MNELKGAIFDMDGVILDTEKLYLRFWKEAAAEFGYDMRDEPSAAWPENTPYPS